MTAYIFPGQGSQFPGMGQDLFENSSLARDRFEQANAILGFNITNIKQIWLSNSVCFLYFFLFV